MDFTLFPFNPRMVFTLLGWVFVKNQPKKSRLDVYNFFLHVFESLDSWLKDLASEVVLQTERLMG